MRPWLAGAVVLAVGCAVLTAMVLSDNVVNGQGQALPVAHVVIAQPKLVPTPVVRPVAAAAPTTFTIAGPAFKVQAHVCSMPAVFPLDPPGEQHHTVCWVQKDFGVAPSSDANGTSYILGHAWAEDADEVMNPLSIYAMDHVNMAKPFGRPATSDYSAKNVPTYPVGDFNGYTITLNTAKGALTYTVTEAFAVAKNLTGEVSSVMNTHIPNRVEIITCGVHNGVDVDVDIIVDAYLSSFRANAT